MATDPFSGIIGHARVIELLRRDAPEPAQAYLFSARSRWARRCWPGGSPPRSSVPPKVCTTSNAAPAVWWQSGSHPDVSVIEPEGRDQPRGGSDQIGGDPGCVATRRGADGRCSSCPTRGR